jgi:hypothetical protein
MRSINQKWEIALENYKNTLKIEVNLGRCELLFDEVNNFL